VGREGRCRGGFPADCDSVALKARIAVGPHQGQKALTLQTVPARAEGERNAVRLNPIRAVWRQHGSRDAASVNARGGQHTVGNRAIIRLCALSGC